MTHSSRYPSTPIGQELGRFYEHRSILRRTVPLFSVTWQDFVHSLKGEAAATMRQPRKAVRSQSSGHNGPQNHTHCSAHA
ncbi:hypothetical protein CDEF62S_01463 [Castellaniella defragrans]